MSTGRFTRDPLVIVDVSPLWELQYTGVSNVVFELSKRFLRERRFDVEFTVFGKCAPRGLIEACVNDKSGTALHQAFNLNGGPKDIEVDHKGMVKGRETRGLFTNTKPPRKVYCSDSQIFYDFSFLLTPECHTNDTVNHHTAGIADQIASCDLLFCISDSTARDLKWLFSVPDDKLVITLLGNSADTTLSDTARQIIGNVKVEPFLLILGTIEPRKNLSIIFEWLQNAPGLLERYRLIVAGREGWGPSFMELIDRFQLRGAVESGRITHLGYVDEALKATLLVGAAGVIYPSIFEGFGLPVLEAMAIGTPVLSSCSTSLPEVLGDCGYYFDPYCVESLNSAVSTFELARQSGQITKVIERAKDRARGFSYDKTYQIMAESLINR